MTTDLWAVEHRRHSGYVISPAVPMRETEARLTLAECHAAGMPCVLLRAVVGPWLPVDDGPEAA